MPPPSRNALLGYFGLLIAGVSSLVGCGGAPGQVTRVVHGSVVEGPYIGHRAYASFLAGRLAEADGRLDQAESKYADAARADEQSPEPLARLGAVRCARGDVAGANDAFEKALARDPEYEPTWTERSRCALAHGSTQDALADARRALVADPDSVDATVAFARALVRTGSPEQAQRALDAFASRRASQAGLDAYERSTLAHALGDEGSKQEGANRDDRSSDASEPDARVERALRDGSMTDAAQLASRAHWTTSRLALSAVDLGQPRYGLELARRVLAADPADGEARVAALAAADLLGDEQSLRWALDFERQAAPRPAPLSAIAARVLRRVVARRSDATGADADVAAHGAPR